MIFIIVCLAIAMCFAGCDDKKEEVPITPTKDTIKLIVFNENDSSHEESVEKGADKKIAFSNDSYLFYGYYTEKNGQGTRVTDSKGNILESFYTQATEKTYNAYPKIEAKQVNITLLSSTGEQFQMYHPSQEEQNLPQAHKKGYTFMGWGDYEGETYEESRSVINKIVPGSITKDTILYPKFQPKEFTILGNSTSTVIQYGNSFYLAHEEIVGQYFMGYYSATGGLGRQITDTTGMSVGEFLFAEDEEETATVTYYAYYLSGDIYQITIPNQGLSNQMVVVYKNFNAEGSPDKEVVYEKGQTIENLKPKRDGYFFDGWYADANLFKKFDFDVAHFEEENLALYPKWVALPTNRTEVRGILSDATQGTITLSSSDEAVNYHAYYSDFTGTITVLCTAFTEKGDSNGAQVFIGGNDIGDMADGARKTVTINVKQGEIVYFIGSPIKSGEEITFNYTITGGIPTLTSSVKADVPVVFNTIVTVDNYFKLPTFSKAGYTFQGYTTVENDPSTLITDSTGKSLDRWEYTENMTVYAYYTQNI